MGVRSSVVVVSSSPSGELPGLVRVRFEDATAAAAAEATFEALEERCVDWRLPLAEFPPAADPDPAEPDLMGDFVLLLALEEDDWFLVRTIDIDSALSARPAPRSPAHQSTANTADSPFPGNFSRSLQNKRSTVARAAIDGT